MLSIAAGNTGGFMKLLPLVVLATAISLASYAAIPETCYSEGTNIQSDTFLPVGKINEKLNALADQLDKNAINKDLSRTFIVTSFTNLDKLEDTTAVGRLIAENLMHGLQINKWQILEIRLTKGVDVNASGEFSLSRDIKKLKDEYKIRGIVTGTYSLAEGNLTINARAIDVNTGLLISSAQTYIPAEWLAEASIPGMNSSNSMKILSDGIK
jgi:TolB-like protein